MTNCTIARLKDSGLSMFIMCPAEEITVECAFGSNFADHSGPLTEICLLGNLAVRTGKPIEWDAEGMRATNVPEANAFLDEPYRTGWSL